MSALGWLAVVAFAALLGYALGRRRTVRVRRPYVAPAIVATQAAAPESSSALDPRHHDELLRLNQAAARSALGGGVDVAAIRALPPFYPAEQSQRGPVTVQQLARAAESRVGCARRGCSRSLPAKSRLFVEPRGPKRAFCSAICMRMQHESEALS